MNDNIKFKGRVRIVAKDEQGNIVDVREADNLITTAGLSAIADGLEAGYASGTPAVADAFNQVALGTTTGGPSAPAIGNNISNVGVEDAEGLRAVDSGYPKRGDTDPDNSGVTANTITWRATFPNDEYQHADITDAAIASATAVWNGSQDIFNHVEFGAVDKQNVSISLKVFLNITVT